MRLLIRQSNGELCLTGQFLNDVTPPYAILSHRWGDEGQELTYEDLSEGTGQNKSGYKKLQFCAKQAAGDGLQYFWVDTCCIKKTSDAELSSSINSMFRWYQRANKCYAYLSDVSTDKNEMQITDTWEQAFRESKWFTRGWTLQELLAPNSVEFFSSEGKRLGDRVSLKTQIHEITGISLQALEGKPLHTFPISERNSWAANRVTTIEEDMAYCLIGIFDVSMSSRYGEGKEKAMERLDNKIRKRNDTTGNKRKIDEISNVSKAEVDAMLQWLACPDHSTNYHNALKLRQSGTGLWFLQHDSYLEWIAGRSKFLWLHGIPGCGKSVLSSTILENLLERAEDTQNNVVYFYFDFNDPQKRRVDLMVRSILAQLLRQCDDVSAALAALYSTCGKGGRQPSLSSYLDVLKQTVSQIPKVFLLLDALDECDERKELLKAITDISRWDANNLHVLLTSRKERDVEATLEQIVESNDRISLQSEQVDPDIQAYIVERLSKDKSLEKWYKNNEAKAEIESALMKKAQGMFRWAACQLDAITRCRNRAQLRKSLSTLPPTLDKTYERILCAIGDEDAEYAVRILRWLAFAERPLLLREIAEIVAFDLDREIPFDREEILEDPLEILDICSSLIRIITVSNADMYTHTNYKGSYDDDMPGGTGQAVRLAHYSVQEYLTSDRCVHGQASRYALSETLCHTFISETCLSAVLVPIPNVLSNYTIDWIAHARKGQRSPRWVQRALAVCLNLDRSILKRWIWSWHSDEVRDLPVSDVLYDSIPDGLLFISLIGFTEVAIQLIEKYGHQVNGGGEMLGNPLQAASLEGHKEMVELLISKGADVNAEGGVHGTALQAAASRGHRKIVEILISKGADVNARGGWCSPALQAAVCEVGQFEMVKLLISKGADVNAGDGHGTTLLVAADSGRLNMVELLISKGADVNAEGEVCRCVPWCGPALITAVHTGDLEIADFLISKGANIDGKALPARARKDTRAFINKTAVQVAWDKKSTEMAQLLIRHGADVDALSSEYSDLKTMAVSLR